MPLPRFDVYRLVQAKIYFHVDLHRDRLAVFHGGLELPVANRFDSFLIQAHAQRSRYLDVARLAIRANDQP